MNEARHHSRVDSATAEAVRRFMARVQDSETLPGVVIAALLFGSRARGEQRPESDADVAVLLEGEHVSRVDVALHLADIAFDVMLETGILIEAIPLWHDEWAHPERFSNPALIEEIRREGIYL
jgi:predicted nucleotidyltransferase